MIVEMIKGVQQCFIGLFGIVFVYLFFYRFLMEEVVVYCGWSPQQLSFTSDQNNNKLKKDLSAIV